jgi:hypothetical protein
MTPPIISADQRLAERRGVKGVLVGKSGIGKTSQIPSRRRTPLASAHARHPGRHTPVRQIHWSIGKNTQCLRFRAAAH